MPAEQSAINLNRPIKSVRIISGLQRTEVSGQEAESCSLNAERSQKASLSQACQALNAAAARLRQFHNSAVVRYKEDIARLSVEIARRILAQKIQTGDYKIETIVKEAMQDTPTDQVLEIHLNPADLEQCKNTLQAELNCSSTGIQFVPDANIGRAECLINSAKGTIESLIDVHLEKISEALTKAV